MEDISHCSQCPGIVGSNNSLYSGCSLAMEGGKVRNEGQITRNFPTLGTDPIIRLHCTFGPAQQRGFNAHALRPSEDTAGIRHGLGLRRPHPPVGPRSRQERLHRQPREIKCLRPHFQENGIIIARPRPCGYPSDLIVLMDGCAAPSCHLHVLRFARMRLNAQNERLLPHGLQLPRTIGPADLRPFRHQFEVEDQFRRHVESFGPDRDFHRLGGGGLHGVSQ